jgi:tight adherence protein C
MEPVALAVALLLVGTLMFVGTAAWSVRESRRAALGRRLSGLAEAPGPEAPSSGVVMTGLLARVLAPLTALARPRKTEDTQHLALQLTRAGLRGPHAARIYVAMRLLAAVAGLIAYLVYAAQRTEPIPAGPAFGVILFTVGYYAPAVWLDRRTRARQTAIAHGLPDMLDLLVTCVEAGLGLDAAMQRVAAEIALAHPVLAAEIELAYLEVNAGIRRAEALRRLADRTGVADLKSLAATLIQTEIFGTSIADALRIQADGMRIRRMQLAEERAATVSVKLTLPLVLFILPSLLCVILGPAVVNIRNAFSHVNFGGHR